MPPKYKLIYFDGRGAAEPIRWIFHYNNIPFEDVRVPVDGLTPEKKKELGLIYGVVPGLEVDGKMFGQSGAIGRYLARKYGLMPKDELEAFKVEEIMDALGDYIKLWGPLWAEKDEAKKAEMTKKIVEVETPAHFSRFNAILEKNHSGWFVGNSVTYADLYMGHFASQSGKAFNIDIGLKNYPAIEKLIAKVENLKGIKEWIARRPDTPF